MSRTSPVHYIAPSAISITPNANGSVNDLAVYVARGAKIRVYSPRAGIGYDGNAEYKQWTLTGRNRRLTASQTPYTIYARISKTDTDDGYVVFAQKVLDGDVWKDKYPYVTTDGLAKGTAGRNTGNYWYIRIGDVSIPSEGARTVTLDTGILGTDQYNTDWSVSPDALPLRVEVSCVVDDEDVGQNAYVYWDQVLVMTASLVEGWTGTDAQRFRHWSIMRNTGNSDADAAWLLKDYVRAFKTTGSIRLSHIRGSFDDFGGAVSTMFTVTAWGVPEGQDDADESEYVVLAELPVSILSETAEKYELVLTPNIIGYNPTTEEYSPAGGCVVSLRATDQRSDVFDVTFAQFRGAQLAVSYAEVGSSTWVPLTFSGSDDMPAQAVIPVSAFAAQKSLNVRLVNAAAKELDSDTVAFVRDGEDSRDREWIFLRSQEPITFGDASSEHPAPSYIQSGEVNPSGAAGAVTEDKNQEGWVPQGWWDEQQGTDADNPYEYGSYRDYVRATDEEDGHWGDFSMPRIWTHYGEDGILYSILTDADSVSIPTDQASVTTGFNAVFQRKAGDNTPAAYQCYYAAYRRHGNTYNRFEHSGLTRVSSVVFGNIAVSSDSTSQNYCEAIVIYISDSPLSAGALQSAPPDSYLAKKEISVIKDGNTGPSGEDAYGVYVNPGYAIFEETLNSGIPVVDTSGWVGVIQVLKGSAPQPFKLTYGQHSHCRPTSDSTQEDTSVLEATVKFDLLKTQGAYSSEGYLAISVATDDGAYTNTNVKIPYYLSLLDTLKKAAANWFLSKEYDDTAKGNINFEKDVAVGGDFSVAGDAAIDGILMALEQIFTNRIQSDNFNGDGPFDTGFELTKGVDGITSLVIDKLFVRMKAIFNELEIRKISYSGGNIIFSHAGSKVVYVTEIYEGGYEYQENIIVVDEGYHEHRGIFGVNGEYNKETRGITLIGAHLEPNPVPRPSDDKIVAYRCYLLADDGSTATENWWRVDDQARWETFNIKEGTYQNVANTFGWRKVIATGTSPLHDGKMYDYIDLSRTDCASGSDIPKVGDELVQMGNRTDAERQGFVTIEVAGDYAPAFKVYKGVNGYTLDGKRKVCISPKLTDIKAQRFVIETEYDAARVPFQRSEPWYVGMHCYYYDLVQHKGASWLCTFPEEGHEGVMYTTEEPSETATYWRIYAQKGEKGDSVSYDKEHSSIGYAYSSMGSPEQGREYPSDITSWSPTPPTAQKGKYLWTKDDTAYNNAGTIVHTITYGVEYQPNDGESVEIDSSRTFIKYCRQTKSQYTGQHPADSDFSVTYPTNLGQGDYLWILNQVAYVGVIDALKSYSVSMLGTDGTNGDPGADGYTTHFAYATSADGSQNFSTTNFQGATYIGTYRDQRAADSTNYRDYVWTKWKGEKGDSVTVDEQNSKTEYVVSNQGTSAPTSGWTTTIPSVPQGQFLWTRVTTAYSDGSSTVSYGVSYNAEDGADGADGTSVTITSKSVKYAVTNNGTQPADSSFTYNTIPPLELGQYLWTKTEVAYSDGNSTKAYSVSRLGTDGEDGQAGADGYTTHFAYATSADGSQGFSTTNFNGATYIGTYRDQNATDSTNYRDYTWTAWKGDKGDKGDNGRGITSVNIYFKADSTTTPATPSGAPSGTGWTDDGNSLIVPSNANKHLYESTCTAYSDGTYSWTTPIDDGLISDMASTAEEFALSDSNTTAPTSGWASSVNPIAGKWVWSRTVLTYKSGNPTYVSIQCVGYCGNDGKNVATCYVESQNVFITVDKDGKVVSDVDYVMVEVPFRVISGDKILCNLTATLSEDGSVNYAYFGNGGIYDPTNSHMTREGRGISIEGAYYEGRGIVLPADMTYTPSKVIIRVPKDTVLDEHAVHLNITATDDDGSTYTCLGDIQINGRAEGDDAVNASLTSPVVIIQQQTVDPYGLILTFAFTDILVTEGKSDVTDSITNVTLTPSKYDGVHDCCVVTRSGRRVTITQIATHSVGGKNVYVEEGTVDILFVYKGVTYNLPFRFKCNLLGTWKEEVIGDTETAVAEKITYGYDHETGEAGSLESIGKYIRSSENNISELQGTVYDEDHNVKLVTKTTFEQTINRISLSVESKENTNLVPDPDIYQMLASAITRNISLVKDRKYTLTARLKNTSSTATSCTIDVATLTTLPCSLASGAVDNFSKTFTAPATGTFTLTVPQTANVLLEWLQVEQGSAFTKHDNIGSAFQRTGIDIENGLITLDAGTVQIKNGDSTAALFTNGKIKADYIDAVNIVSIALTSQTITAVDATIKNITIEGSSVFRGTIYAVDGEFTGTITAKQGGNIGGFKVDYNLSLYAFSDGLDAGSRHNGHVDSLTIKPSGVTLTRGRYDNSTTISALQSSIIIGPAAELSGDYHGNVRIVNRHSDTSWPLLVNFGIYLDVQGARNWDDDPTYGNHALLIAKGNIAGFRKETRRVGSSQTLSIYDNNVICTKENITLTLPNAPEDGQEYTIIPYGRVYVAASGSDKIRYPNGASYTTATFDDYKHHWLIYDSVNKLWLADWGG